MNHRRYFYLSLFFLLWWIGTGCLAAQEGRGNGRLAGEVRDAAKKPLPGVRITLRYLEFDYSRETTSDGDGNWSLLGLGSGNVRLTAAKEGYRTEEQTLRVSGVSRNPPVSVVLKAGTAAAPVGADRFHEANALFAARQYEQAMEAFHVLRRENPQGYRLAAKVAACLTELRRYEEAEAELKELLRLDGERNVAAPEQAAVMAQLGDVYLRWNKADEAAACFKTAIERNPGDHLVAYNVGEILFSTGKVQEALPYYRAATSAAPTWPNAHRQLGYALLNLGQTAEALTHLRKYLELAPAADDAAAVQAMIQELTKK